MIINCTTDRMNEVYDKYKQYFLSNFHSVLWHLYVENTFAGNVICFVQNFKNGGIILGIATANESGYTPTPAYFADGIHYDKAQVILDELNKDVFGLNDEATTNITTSSMSKSVKQEESAKRTIAEFRKESIVNIFEELIRSYEQDLKHAAGAGAYDDDELQAKQNFIAGAKTTMQAFKEYRPAVFILIEGGNNQGAHVSESISIEVYDDEKTAEENGYTSEEWERMLTEGEDNRELRTTW